MTLVKWKRLPALWEEVRRRQDELIPAADAEAWEATIRAAIEGGARDRRLYWELRGRLRRGAPVAAPVSQVNVMVRP